VKGGLFQDLGKLVAHDISPAPVARRERPGDAIKRALRGNDVLPVGDDLVLEVYEEKTVSTGEHVSYRLRYFGTSPGGGTRIDVMLRQYKVIA
jgi:hypothetical protein